MPSKTYRKSTLISSALFPSSNNISEYSDIAHVKQGNFTEVMGNCQ